MKKVSFNPTIHHIPEAIIFKILLHMPIKAMLRCKIVCKLWYNIIDDPAFVYMHSKTIYNKPQAYVSLLECCRVFIQPLKPFGFNFLPVLGQDEASNQGQGRNQNENNCVWTRSKMPRAWFSPYQTPDVRSCNGLLCLMDNYTRKLQVINPLLYLGIDTYEVEFPYPSSLHIGFGFDESSHRFKIVCPVPCSGEGGSYYISLFVHELDARGGCNISSAWRELSQPLGSLNFFFDNNESMFLDGCIYWLATLRNRDGRINTRSIMSFNLTTEVLEFELLPKKVFCTKLERRDVFDCRGITYLDNLVDINGTLGLVMNSDQLNRNDGSTKCRVFCRDEDNNSDGLTKKWIMKFCIKLPLGHAYIHVVGFLKEHLILMKSEEGNYFSYNSRTGNSTHLSELPKNVVFICHRGSLIRPSNILDVSSNCNLEL